MATIFHIALASDWAAALAAGAYTTSTRGMTLAEVGFIHASRADQWTATRERFYADVDEPLVLLQIDTELLDVPLIDEQGHPDSPETFPHIYGRLLPSAVVRAIPLDDAAPVPLPGIAPVTTTPSPAAQQVPTGGFTESFFRGMAFNAALVVLAMAVSLAGMAIGQVVDEDAGPGIGGVLGLLVGVGVAARLHRRQAARA